MKRKPNFLTASISFLAVLAMPAQLIAHAQSATPEQRGATPHYRLTDLGVVGPTPGQPFHISDDGIISGSAQVHNAEHAFLWYRRLSLDIGARGLGGSNSISYGVNRWGQAVGEADTAKPDPLGEDFCGFATLGYASGTECVPFVWQAGVMRRLPTLLDVNGMHGNNGVANVINSRGEIAGLSENTVLDSTCPAYAPSKGQNQKLQQKPVVWRDGHIAELPTVGGDPDGNTFAINEHGQVAGGTGTCAPFNFNNFLYLQFNHAVLWNNGLPIDLGNLGGALGNFALGINDRGDVVGSSDLANDAAFNGFLWTKDKGHMDALIPFGSDAFSVALAVNNRREATGVSLSAAFAGRATLWLHGKPHDLNALIPSTSGLYLLLACGVNDSGEIIGLAVDSGGLFHGYLATPRGERDEYDASLDGPMRLSDGMREMIRKQLHFDHRALAPTNTAP